MKNRKKLEITRRQVLVHTVVGTAGLLVATSSARAGDKFGSRLSGPDCQPLVEALLDVWHANDDGIYDLTSPDFLWRGRMNAGKDGTYSFDTILPGRYRSGPEYRPRHIHFKVISPGFLSLTTQLYFEGDPYLKVDPFVRPSLIIPLEGDRTQWSGTFNIILGEA